MGLLYEPFSSLPAFICGAVLPALIAAYFVYVARVAPSSFGRRVLVASFILFVIAIAMPVVRFHPLHGILTVSFLLGTLVCAAVVALGRRWARPGLAVGIIAWVISSPIFIAVRFIV